MTGRFLLVLPIVVAASVISSRPALAQATQDAPFTLRESEPATGTRINRTFARSTDLPMDRGYGALTPEQQAMVRGWYDDLKPDDEPPYPVGGIKVLYGSLGKIQRQLRIQGDVEMDVEIDAQGVAQNVRVYHSPDADTTRAIANVLLVADYKPGKCAGQACRMWFPFKARFKFE